MKHILVPLDGSALAEQVLPYVRVLAPLLHADVLLLQALDHGGQEPFLAEEVVALDAVSGSVGGFERRSRTVRDMQHERARGYLADQAERLQRTGIEATTVVRIGAPAEVIIEMSDPNTLIAMATHGYSGVRRWALGSIADKVLHAATGPVLLVRGETPVAEPSLKRLLVPLDGSALAQQALPLAVELAGLNNAELVLLRSIEPFIDRYAELQPFGYTQPPDEAWILEQRADIKRDLATRAEQVRQRYPNTRAIVNDGYPAETIIDEAKRLEADLIVMATHGRSGLGRWALGSVADKVLHSTHTPLLLVRARRS